MGKRKKEKEQDIGLIPLADDADDIEETVQDETDGSAWEPLHSETGTDTETNINTDATSEEITTEPSEEPTVGTPEESPAGISDVTSVGVSESEEKTESGSESESEASELFGAYVNEETKWERKNRIRDEKERRKAEKKRAKYKDVDDETYESMKAHPAHVFFGVLCIFLLLGGMTLAALGVYKLAVSPSYAKVGEAEKNLQIDGLATAGDAATLEQITVLQGVSTPSDLTDTWVEQEFATQTDAAEQPEAPEDTTQADDASAEE